VGRLLNPPQSMTELVSRDDIKIIVQVPRTSTPGLGLLLWIKSIYGDSSQAVWKSLDSKIVTYTPGWSEAYGMFLENEADMVLSYTTSPAYHLMYENTSKYKAASFKEGHYMQIEVAGILKSSQNFNLAQKFMKFISTEEFQSQIPTKNIMYPVTNIVVPDAFNQLNQINKKLLMKPELVHGSKKAWINEWLNSQ
jgi:thiamine transport system substrate-binding protein